MAVSESSQFSIQSPYFRLIEDVLGYIHQNIDRELSLSALAKKFRVSEFYFQKIFKRWAGISPKQYIQYLKLQAAKNNLKPDRSRGRTLMSASLRSGLSSTSRLHDLFVNIEAMTPLQYREMGKGMEILYGFPETPFGKCLIGISTRGICFLNFLEDESQKGERLALRKQKENWKNAQFKLDSVRAESLVKRIFKGGGKPVSLLLKGTNFQVKVWEALLKINRGDVSNYKRIAQKVGMPDSARAVGNACGRNDLAFVIPCHRVLTSSGGLGGYKWGEKKKFAMLEWEKMQKLPLSLRSNERQKRE